MTATEIVRVFSYLYSYLYLHNYLNIVCSYFACFFVLAALGLLRYNVAFTSVVTGISL